MATIAAGFSDRGDDRPASGDHRAIHALLRTEAWKTQSRDNLHNIGLALHNYHDVYRAFPPGGVIRDDDLAMHGWCTSIWPFIDSNPHYVRIDFNVPWDHPRNAEIFHMPWPILQIPGVESNVTVDGFGLTHYLANPDVMHQNSHTSIDKMSAGLKAELAGG